MKQLKLTLLAQSVYYILTGLWPLVSMDSFLMATGPKTDLWLVRMVALLIVSIGLSILIGKNQPGAQTYVLSVFSAACFIAIDVIYTLNGTIPEIYLADAVLELLFILLVVAALLILRRNRNTQKPKLTLTKS